MIKSIIAGIVVAVAVALPNAASAASNPTVTSVELGNSAGIAVYVVTMSNGIVANVPQTSFNSTDNPTIGAVISYRFDDGWFTDGIAVEQTNAAWYGNVQ